MFVPLVLDDHVITYLLTYANQQVTRTAQLRMFYCIAAVFAQRFANCSSSNTLMDGFRCSLKPFLVGFFSLRGFLCLPPTEIVWVRKVIRLPLRCLITQSNCDNQSTNGHERVYYSNIIKTISFFFWTLNNFVQLHKTLRVVRNHTFSYQNYVQIL